MLIIGELINGMYGKIGKAVAEKDKQVIQDSALSQIKAGAGALDVNCGPASKDPIVDTLWLIKTIQEVTDKPICIDSSKVEVIEEALKLVKENAIINSTTADTDKLNQLVPLAKEKNAKLIALTISADGIPQTKDQRLELAAQIVSYCIENNFSVDELYLDPIVMPVNIAQGQEKDILESIKEFKLIADPAPKTIIGLSNVSQGALNRPIINRTFLAMAMAFGLDAAILDPLDSELMDTAITTDLILNKHIYCDNFLEAYRKR
jgi:5-methyltetrahydrofolate corrinoid/iron sulfur protein methyltransferase